MSIKRVLGKVIDWGKRSLGKVKETYSKARTLGKQTMEAVKEKYPSAYKLGLEAILNSPYGDKVRGAEDILRNIDNLAEGSTAKKVEAVKALGRMALNKDLSLAGSLERGAEAGMRYIQTRAEGSSFGPTLSALSPVIKDQIRKGIGIVREKEEEYARDARMP